MKIINQTQTDRDIASIQDGIDRSLRAVVSAKDELNNLFSTQWNLPDDRLISVLQALHDNNRLEEVFEKHYIAATAINTILDSIEYQEEKAIDKAGREFVIDDGKVSLIAKVAAPLEIVITDGVLSFPEVVAQEPEVLFEEQPVIEDLL
jgi:hypothetical protein